VKEEEVGFVLVLETEPAQQQCFSVEKMSTAVFSGEKNYCWV